MKDTGWIRYSNTDIYYTYKNGMTYVYFRATIPTTDFSNYVQLPKELAPSIDFYQPIRSNGGTGTLVLFIDTTGLIKVSNSYSRQEFLEMISFPSK
ncbi:hypothetical protein [Breznakia sp. PFB1-14]|nr:hypothetical protein [Breznakia sp. PFB1-14]MDH6414275.1 hypothetical protein [Breznakia sp. PFB1-14]